MRPPICDHCTLPIRNAGSNRRKLHTGCEQLVISRTTDPVVRRRLMEARRRRLRKEGLPILYPETKPKRPVAAPKIAPPTPLAAPPCEFCGWFHPEVAEAVQCRARAERASRDVADLRKRRLM